MKISLIITIFILINITSSFDVKKGISKLSKYNKFTQSQAMLNFLADNEDISNANTDYQTQYTTVKVDHFAFDNTSTFKLRYLVKDKYFDKTDKTAPILFYCGNEGAIEDFYNNSGFITENLAQEFKGLVIFAEHRFFGESMPFGGQQDYDVKKNKFLTVEQAMSDFVELLREYKEKNDLKDHPVIAFGGSYGGMLSSWSRMKFPHVYAGAVASSAPVLLFEDIDRIDNNFFKIVTNTYRRYDEKCPDYIRQGFKTLFEIRNSTSASSNPSIIAALNEIFQPCQPIKNATEIKMLEDALEDAIVELAQYNYPYPSHFLNPSPGTPVKVACERIESYKNSTLGDDIFAAMAYGFAKWNQIDPLSKNYLTYLKEASQVYFNYTGSTKCIDIGNNPNTTSAPNGWSYLACTEMVMPMQKNGVTDMFNPSLWNLKDNESDCKKIWNADYRPEWAFNYFGGKNFEEETKNYSNILYINGKMDPWNSGCPKSSKNPSIIVYEADSAHHLDLRLPNELDPPSIVEARSIMVNEIGKWVKQSNLNEY